MLYWEGRQRLELGVSARTCRYCFWVYGLVLTALALWSFLWKSVFPRFSTPLFLLLARLLSPAVFGFARYDSTWSCTDVLPAPRSVIVSMGVPCDRNKSSSRRVLM